MNAFRLSPEAHRDLNGLSEYIARNDLDAAERFLNELLDECRFLAEAPRVGRPRPELGRGYRSWPHGNYLIVYRPSREGIRVVRVLHGGQNLRDQFRR